MQSFDQQASWLRRRIDQPFLQCVLVWMLAIMLADEFSWPTAWLAQQNPGPIGFSARQDLLWHALQANLLAE